MLYLNEQVAVVPVTVEQAHVEQGNGLHIGHLVKLRRIIVARTVSLNKRLQKKVNKEKVNKKKSHYI